MWSYYFDNMEALIFVVDSGDRTKIPIIKEEIVRLTQALKDKRYVILFLLNKQDLRNKLEVPDLVHQLEISKIEHIADIIIQRCSALNGEGIEEGLSKLAGHFDKRGVAFK
jgi:signal recognition particle receptor subunit beta